MIIKKITFHIIFSLLWLLALWPMWLLYILSDILFVLIYSCFRYRRKVVKENLSKAFPEKTEKERKRIELKFYRHFCDYIVETIKLINISDKALDRRIKLKSDFMNTKYKEGKNTVAMMGHSGNWEWLSSQALKDNYLWVTAYHPMRNNPDFDRFIVRLRSRFGINQVTMNQTYKHLIKINNSGNLFMAGLIADQSPPNPKNRHWITFLNQDTAVMEGPERIAQRTNAAVCFVKMIKVKRGHYELDYIPITDSPKEEKDLFITERYYEELEKQIKEQPECWLWTHRRWKRKRPEDKRLIKQ